MKDDEAATAVRVAAGNSVFNRILCVWLFFSALSVSAGQAQCMNTVFSAGEKIRFDVYFKWGVLMTKAGEASITVEDSQREDMPVWKTVLLARTIGMTDKLFKVRDTIDTYITKESPRILYSSKQANEGGHYLHDELDFATDDMQTRVRSFRRSASAIKIDTVLMGNDCVLDMLGAVFYARSIDWTKTVQGIQYPLQVAMGRDLINLSYRYEGQQIVERDSVKYRTRLFIIDVYDKAFTQSNEAMELWIGDDDNHFPVKMHAKLKIGAVEAYYNSAENLRFPPNCRVVIPTY
ncbi:hypothetical protein Barb6_00883 [Bacteroidales bacterium Barb6]|nr:hypothetical protein Barb6_00883 [Bacteroidales bacterium Barb6]